MRPHVDHRLTAQRQIRWLLEALRARGHEGVPRAVEVSRQNRTHGPTAAGGRSDHQGPRNYAWAADLPVDVAEDGDVLAMDVAGLVGMHAYFGYGIGTVRLGGYRYQLLWNTEGHHDHVHIGVCRLGVLPPVKAAFA